MRQLRCSKLFLHTKRRNSVQLGVAKIKVVMSHTWQQIEYPESPVCTLSRQCYSSDIFIFLNSGIRSPLQVVSPTVHGCVISCPVPGNLFKSNIQVVTAGYWRIAYRNVVRRKRLWSNRYKSIKIVGIPLHLIVGDVCPDMCPEGCEVETEQYEKVQPFNAANGYRKLYQFE